MLTHGRRTLGLEAVVGDRGGDALHYPLVHIGDGDTRIWATQEGLKEAGRRAFLSAVQSPGARSCVPTAHRDQPRVADSASAELEHLRDD